jgi:YjbE family integral membrane protein
MPGNLHLDLGQGGLSLLATVGSIILIDIVLSGDNALVIGAAASRLPRPLRFLAILWGGAGAIVLRIVLAGVATLLLQIPLLQAIGGIVLMGIAIHLLLPQDGPRIQARDRFWPAIATILIADATMSLDNIIAIGALAKGNLVVLALGLVVSMLVLFLASAVIARLIERLAVLLDLASLVLAYTAANLVLVDPLVGQRLTPLLPAVDLGPLPTTLALNAAFVLIVLLVDIGLRVSRARHQAAEPLPEAAALAPGSMNGAYIDSATADAFAAPAREPVASRPLAAADGGDDGIPADV